MPWPSSGSGSGRTGWTPGSRPQYDRPDIREPGRKSLVANPGLMFYASGTGKLFHRSIREGLRFEGRVLGDQPWTLRALLRAGDRIEVIGDVVYEWDRDRGPATRSPRSPSRSGVGGACGGGRRGGDRGAARPSVPRRTSSCRTKPPGASSTPPTSTDWCAPTSRDPSAGRSTPAIRARAACSRRSRPSSTAAPPEHRGSLGRHHRAGAPAAARALGSRAPRCPPRVLVDGPCAARRDRRAGSPPQVAARARSTRHRATVSGPRRHPARQRRGDVGGCCPPYAGPSAGARSIRDGHGRADVTVPTRGRPRAGASRRLGGRRRGRSPFEDGSTGGRTLGAVTGPRSSRGAVGILVTVSDGPRSRLPGRRRTLRGARNPHMEHRPS